MKRSVLAKTLTCAAIFTLVGLTGCGGDEPRPSETASNASEWQRPPSITEARWSDGRVVLLGEAEPYSRVVFAEAGGSVHAGNADQDGRFDISLNVPPSGLWLKPRSQIGQTFVDGLGEVYLLASPGPLAITLINGEASRRVGTSGPLDAVDSDGAVLIFSGRSKSSANVRVDIGAETYSTRSDANGRWSLVTNGAGPVSIGIEGKHYEFPGIGGESGARPVNGGWLITRDLGGNAVQTTWIPVDM
ncbi:MULTISPECIES: hypothetical protein [unclassified Brevundimonas]|uniref:hypothetical protein n=1 Tax=unclassified Brevundimonas TaxID=2622653 RepID=UPI0025C5FEC6|nr:MULTISPECIES: hypothetical protein [unclassified Brevundimonas]